MPIQSKEFGFTKPGPYIYELLSELNITHETVSKLIQIIDDAAVLIEEDNQHKAVHTTCRLESIGDMLNTIFRDEGNAHAKFYRVSTVVGQLDCKPCLLVISKFSLYCAHLVSELKSFH